MACIKACKSDSIILQILLCKHLYSERRIKYKEKTTYFCRPPIYFLRINPQKIVKFWCCAYLMVIDDVDFLHGFVKVLLIKKFILTWRNSNIIKQNEIVNSLCWSSHINFANFKLSLFKKVWQASTMVQMKTIIEWREGTFYYVIVVELNSLMKK